MKKLITTLCAAAGVFTLSFGQTALNFDGTDDQVVFGSQMTTDLTGVNTFTVEAWVNPSTTAGLAVIIGNYNFPSNNNEMQFLLRRDNDQYAFWIDDGDADGYDVVYSGAASVTTGTWQHVTGVWDGSEIRIYVDGTLLGTNTALTGPGFPATVNEMVMGSNFIGEDFQGDIDNIRIWNDVRTPAEIAGFMNCEVEPNAQGLLAMYHFNDGLDGGTNTSTLLFDNSGNGYHGTLQNFALSGTTSNFVTSNRTDYMSIQAAIGSSAQADRMSASEPADFNGDGYDDILVNRQSGARDIFYSDGFGHFETPVAVPNTIGGAFAVGDIDNDGDIDLANYAGTDFKVYVNDGAGNFTEQTPVTMDGTGSIAVARIADVNGDNLADLVLGNGSNTNATDMNEVWINTGTVGNPAFTFLEGLDPIAPVNGIAIGDIDGDGDADLAFGGGSWPAVVYNNDNNTTFVQGQTLGGYNGYPRFIDWNQDGHLDFVNSDGYNNWGVRVRYNDGTGNFMSTANVIVAVPNGIDFFSFWPVEYADLNGDGFLDVVSRHWGGNGEIYLSNGCILTDQTDCKYKLGPADNAVKTGDFNGDGKPDVFCGARDRKSSVSLNFLTPVTTPALSHVTSTTGDEVCDGDQISIEATVSNTGTINWFSDVAGSSQLGSGSPFSPTAGPGTYTYYVQSENPNGCTSLMDSAEVIVNENPSAALNNANSVLALDCFGDADGSIDVDITLNGTATSASYLWDDDGTGSTSTNEDLTGLPAGTYNLTVTDDNTCTATLSVDVTEPTELVASASVTSSYNGAEVSCNGATDGEITLSVNGGTTGYSFVWDDASNSTTQNLTGVGAGTYNVDVTDANGCLTTASATVTEPDVLEGTTTVTDVSCNGDTDGEVSLNVTGGTTSYSFVWDDASNSTTQNLTGVGTGTYSVDITDANGCTATASGTVTEPDVLEGTTTVTDVSCNGDTDGEVSLNVTGGTTSYSFVWDDASNSTTQNLTGVGAGSYSVDITDANGCTATASATVNEPTALTGSATTVAETNGNDGSIDLTPSGGTSPYSYSWTGPNGFTSTDQNPTGLVGGTYEVTITDDNGCTFVLEVVVDSFVGLDEVSQTSFTLYPNPSNGVFNIETSQAGKVEIFNTNGKIVHTTTIENGKTQLQVSGLAHGVYTLRLSSGQGFQFKKLVIR